MTDLDSGGACCGNKSAAGYFSPDQVLCTRLQHSDRPTRSYTQGNFVNIRAVLQEKAVLELIKWRTLTVLAAKGRRIQAWKESGIIAEIRVNMLCRN